MNLNSKHLVPLLGLLVLLAGCGKGTNLLSPVVIPPLASLSLTPDADTLDVGQTRLFVATALDTSGHPYTGPLDWSSSDRGVFTVSSTGLVHAAGEGSAVLYVAGGGHRDSALVLVFPAATGWTLQTSHATESLNGVYFDPAGRRGWVVGDGGVILSTSDAGASWTRRTPASVNLHGVWFTSALEGWVVGDAGTMLYTADGGTNWERILRDSTSENLMHVYFAAPDVGWVVGRNGFTMRTLDHGDTWRKRYVLPLSRPTLNGVMFAGTQDGWAVGEDGSILGSHDGGASWFLWQPPLVYAPLKAVWQRSALAAVAVGAAGLMPRTVAVADSAAWELRNTGSENQLWGVCFPTDSTGYAVGVSTTAGVVLRSDNGGRTWRPQVARSQLRLNAVFFVDERRGWAVGNGGIIRHTASGGE
jgi:photosystem II stability/assembly factor-like uncharacterized protein